MPIRHFPEEHEKFEIQAYKKPKSIKLLHETHIAFTGSPRKHPYDTDRIILITDPYSKITSYFEFKTLKGQNEFQFCNLDNAPILISLNNQFRKKKVNFKRRENFKFKQKNLKTNSHRKTS